MYCHIACLRYPYIRVYRLYDILPLTDPGLRPTVQNSSYYENGQNFPEYLGQGTLGCRSLSSPPFGCFSSPTNIPTHYS